MRTVSACLFVITIFCITELHDCRFALFSLPVPDRRFKDYFYNHTHHEYTLSETGDDIFGQYLRYKLSKLTTPPYSHKSFYDGNRPLYDHYTIHQYFHQNKTVPSRQEISSNEIMGCVGDSTEVCPANTTSLCTKDAKLMCVTPTTSTVLCKDLRGNRCVKSAISCHHNKSPLCLYNSDATIPVNITCISTIKIHGHVNIINNTVLETPTLSADSDIIHTTFFINVVSAAKSGEPTHEIKIGNSSLYIKGSPLHVDIIQNGKPTSSTNKINEEFCVTLVAVPSQIIKL